MGHAAVGLIPLWPRILYSAFVAGLVPYYWISYSPWNFLFFCDVALLIGVVAIWTERPLLASLPAVGIAIPQLLWCLDFLTGARITGMTSYMFESNRSLFVRGLSLFHGWLPFLLLGMVWRLGFDRRAFWSWTIASTCILLASYFLAPPPPAPADHPEYAVNINYVHGLSYEKSQTMMPGWLWLTIMIVGFTLVFYLPAHLALAAWFPQAREPVRDQLASLVAHV
ncbi:MAG: hypothetical protein ACP5XB_23385 [Isosphaeraceae bacterium]